MEHIICIVVVFAFLICYEAAIGMPDGRVPEGLQKFATQEFEDLMRYIRSTVWGAKIQRTVAKVRTFESYRQELEKCPQRLRNIISEKVNCRGVANKLDTQLLSLQIFQTLLSNDQVWESIILRKNCSQLRGESYKMCEEGLSGKLTRVKSYIETDLNQEIDNCYTEERGNRTNYPSKR